MQRNYIGLANSFHDASIAIVDAQGELVFAEATERPLQYKRTIGIAADLFMYAFELIDRYCDPEAELVIASSWSDDSPAIMQHNLKHSAAMLSRYRGMLGEVPNPLRRQLSRQRFYFQSQLAMLGHPGGLLEYQLSQDERWEFTRVMSRRIEHHLAHAATACFTSPFDQALCAVLDGFGERRSFACYRYQHGKLSEIDGLHNDGWASLGIFYSLLCEACGFNPLSGEEWKVMGLAAYGQLNAELYAMLHEMIQVEGLNLRFAAPARMARIQAKLHQMRRTHQPALEFADLAHTGQQVFADVLFTYLQNLHATGFSDKLVLGGGCALNSSANGKILSHTPFKQLHIFSAPGDDGNAVGAALLAYRQDHPEALPPPARLTPYLGSSLSPASLRNLQAFSGLGKLTQCERDAPERAAALLAQGKIVGWIQGRAEFGPRALGNRSILADPRSPAVKDKINRTVKFREMFRPFAPAILHEFGAKYFYDYHESPYMERTLKFKDSVLSTVPGVVHVDQTGRLQTVSAEWNPRFHALISEFYRLTTVPLVLNTSFNVMGKPIAHSVEDALAVFFTSGLDALFIEDSLIEK